MLVLASQSPRRAELLAQLQLQFTTLNVDIDETPNSQERPNDYVTRMAIEKARAGASQSADEALVLGADTIVVANPDVAPLILGKPQNIADAKNMWQMLSDAQHRVITAVAVVKQGRVKYKLVQTQVWFKSLGESEMDWYWATGEPKDKAGAYGIQGLAGQFVTRIEGSYSAVVGLPLYETKQLLDQMGIK